MLDWDAIADRFFSVYADKPQSEIVRLYNTTSAQVSRWKAHTEKMPLKVLARLVDLEGVSWDWILAGIDPMRRRAAAKPDGKKPPLAPQRPRRIPKTH